MCLQCQLLGRLRQEDHLSPASVFFFSPSTKVWIQGFVLARQLLYHLNHTSSPFALVIFEIGSHFLPTCAFTAILFMLSSIWGMTGLHYHAQLFLSRLSLTNFLLVWPGTVTLQILTSQVARFASVSHQCPVRPAVWDLFGDTLPQINEQLNQSINKPIMQQLKFFCIIS
jgi:hypothetical protein